MTRLPAIAVLPFANLTNDPGSGVLLRRHGGGADQRAVARQGPGRRVANLGVPVQGHAGRRARNRRAARRADGARRQRAQGRQPTADQRAAGQRRRRLPHLVRTVRSQHRRRVPDSGRDRALDHRVAAGDADPAGDRHDGQAGDLEPRRVPLLPARPVPAQQVRRPVRLADRRAQVLRGRGRARSDIFGRLRRPVGGLHRARLHHVPAGAGSQQGGARSGASARSRSIRSCPKGTPRSAGPRRSLPSTCGPPSATSSARSRSHRATRRRTATTRCCSAASAGSTRPSSTPRRRAITIRCG